ncbi:IS66 family insertion sequence element accessory protein TnpB [Enterococcus faecium]|uniref:IS66 family insertion sequence element accessory protein TnpB n=1 Tax=Enterococcus faecium TaxID=1352 RepID=UPI0038B2B1EA
MRKGIDGLASLIQQEYQLELYEDAVFLFCGNRQDVTKSVRFKVVKNFGNYRYVASVASRSP